MGPRGGEQGGGTPRRTGQLGPTPVKRSHVRSGQPPRARQRHTSPLIRTEDTPMMERIGLLGWL